jgi:hypothetical protein
MYGKICCSEEENEMQKAPSSTNFPQRKKYNFYIYSTYVKA